MDLSRLRTAEMADGESEAAQREAAPRGRAVGTQLLVSATAKASAPQACESVLRPVMPAAARQSVLRSKALDIFEDSGLIQAMIARLTSSRGPRDDMRRHVWRQYD